MAGAQAKDAAGAASEQLQEGAQQAGDMAQSGAKQAGSALQACLNHSSNTCVSRLFRRLSPAQTPPACAAYLIRQREQRR